MSQENTEPEIRQPSASLFSKARIATRGIASLLRPAPTASSTGEMCDVISADTRREKRIPPGQVETRKWPVLHAGPTPKTDLSSWNFRVLGLLESPKTWDWNEFRQLRNSKVFADMHCVTRWSMLNNEWEGVRVVEVLNQVKIDPRARFVVVHAEAGYTTNLSLDDFLGDDCLFAWSHNGKALEPDHGGPLRLVVPKLYAWKSAKWVRAIELVDKDRPGFWEENGYHNHGDPWAANARGTDSVERFW